MKTKKLLKKTSLNKVTIANLAELHGGIADKIIVKETAYFSCNGTCICHPTSTFVYSCVCKDIQD